MKTSFGIILLYLLPLCFYLLTKVKIKHFNFIKLLSEVILVALIFGEIIPEVLHHSSNSLAASLFYLSMGGLFIYLIEFMSKESILLTKRSLLFRFIALWAIGIHFFLDGMMLELHQDKYLTGLILHRIPFYIFLFTHLPASVKNIRLLFLLFFLNLATYMGSEVSLLWPSSPLFSPEGSFYWPMQSFFAGSLAHIALESPFRLVKRKFIQRKDLWTLKN